MAKKITIEVCAEDMLAADIMLTQAKSDIFQRLQYMEGHTIKADCSRGLEGSYAITIQEVPTGKVGQ